MNLLLECARANPHPARVSLAAEAVSEWGAVIERALCHGLAPLVYWHVSRACHELVPRAVLERLHQAFRASALHSLKLTADLLHVNSLFERAGIEAVLFKGPAVAWSLYETPALREMSDIDLLIHPQDRSRAMGLLRSAGYEPCYPCDVRFLHPGREMSFVSAETGSAVDLHWALTPPQFCHGLDMAGVWNRLVEVPVAGRTVRTLGTHDLLIFLCIHGAKHGWTSLHWLSDLARLIGNGGIDWDGLVAHVRVRQTSRMLFAGLLLSADLLGASVPAAVIAAARADNAASRIATDVQQRILADTPVQTNRLEELGFQLGLLERTADKLRSCWGQLEPEPSDYESLSLPPRLFPLYYAFRPLRLAAKYTGQAVRHVIERAKEFAAELDFAQPFGDSKRLGEREGVAPVTRTR